MRRGKGEKESRRKKLWLKFKKSNLVQDFKVSVYLARFGEKKKGRQH
jgi:hypothetical protein